MVNHFDIKADNFLLECDLAIPDEVLFNPTHDVPIFKICLADFGESQVYTNNEENFTTENRGTEYIKSPEMLTIAYATKKEQDAYDRLRKVGAGPASDIWSLGCLFFELLTDKFLFYEREWVQFYVRVTVNTYDLISQQNADLLSEFPDALTFLKSVLIRDPKYRPAIQDMIRGYKVTQNKIIEQKKKSELLEEKETEPEIGPTQKEIDEANATNLLEAQKEGNRSRARPVLTRQASSTFLIDKVTRKFKAKEKKGDKQSEAELNPTLEKEIAEHSKKIELLKQEREKNQQLRQQHLKQINFNSVKYSEDEYKFFRETPTKVTNYLYLGDWSLIRQRTRLQVEYGITHVADCTNSQNVFTEHFFFERIDPTQDLVTGVEKLSPFVRNSVAEKGRVLVAYDDAFGPSVAIGYIMEAFTKTFFEAFQIVYKSRYVISLNARLSQELLSLERKDGRDIKQYFSCFCGANKYILLEPLDQTEHQNPVPCCCRTTSSEESFCPYLGCANFLEEMAEKHGFHDEVVRWGYTDRDNVQGDFEFCEEFSPELDLSREQRELITPKNWKVHRCRRCLFLTHAVNDDKFAIVTNKNVTPKNAGDHHRLTFQ